MEATLEDTMVDTIPTTVMFLLAARGERLLLSLLLTLKRILTFSMEDTMEATLEDTMVDTIPTTVMFLLGARGERLLLSLLLTPKLTLGCTTTATILLTTMEGTMEDTTPMCMENKRMPYYATTDEMTPTVSNFQKICLSASVTSNDFGMQLKI